MGSEQNKCICGHAESMHYRAIGGCRGERCSCPDFLNLEHLRFLKGCVRAAIQEVEEAETRLREAGYNP